MLVLKLTKVLKQLLLLLAGLATFTLIEISLLIVRYIGGCQYTIYKQLVYVYNKNLN